MKNSLYKIYLLFALTNVVASNRDYKRQTAWPLVADNELSTLKVRSKVECASFLDISDSGFAFDQSDDTCYLLHCVNPNVTDASVDMASIHLYWKRPLSASYTLARGKPAEMSATYAGGGLTFEAGKAVDGIYLPDGVPEYSSVAISGGGSPWWRVDLEQIYCIWGVNILNRAYADSSQRAGNKDVDVTVSRDETQLMYDINPDSRCNYFDGLLNQYYTLITCIQPMRGQFAQIQYRPSSHSTIRLYEIEVFGV